MFLADFSLRSKCFRGRDEKQRITAVFFLALIAFFARAKHWKFRASVFHFSPTPRKHLLHRLSRLFLSSHIASLFTQESLQPSWRGYIVIRLDS